MLSLDDHMIVLSCLDVGVGTELSKVCQSQLVRRRGIELIFLRDDPVAQGKQGQILPDILIVWMSLVGDVVEELLLSKLNVGDSRER